MLKTLLLLLSLSAMVAPLAAQPLRVMAFNVRFPSSSDGEDIWEKRQNLFVEMVNQQAPDLIGTQELFKIQGDHLVAKLPQYAWFGTSRRGNDQDEHMGVFYRKNRLSVVEWGQFWLSETPDVAGSQSWQMTLPRMVTWGLFRTRDGRRFYLLNTHFAHRREDEDARLKSAAVIRDRMKNLKPGIPVLVTGDFNAPAGGPVHAAMLAADLKDSRAVATITAGPEGTFHGFRGTPGTARIDWILVGPQWRVLRNETITDSKANRFPSDHFPVLAVVDIQK